MTGLILFALLFSGVMTVMLTGGLISHDTIFEILMFGMIIVTAANPKKSMKWLYGIYFILALAVRWYLIGYLNNYTVVNGCIIEILPNSTIVAVMDIFQLAIYIIWLFLLEALVGFTYASKCNKCKTASEVTALLMQDNGFDVCAGTLVVAVYSICGRMMESYAKPFQLNFYLFVVIVILVHVYIRSSMRTCATKRLTEIAKEKEKSKSIAAIAKSETIGDINADVNADTECGDEDGDVNEETTDLDVSVASEAGCVKGLSKMHSEVE